MLTIKINYNSEDQFAEISPGQDCTPIAWGAICTFFEESYPSLVENRRNKLRIPWWAFLSIRQNFRYVLNVNKVKKLELSDSAKELLLEAIEKERQYTDAEEKLKERSTDSIHNDLKSKGFIRVLLPYQVRNIERLSELRAAATFSVPGAGKTTEALAFFFLTKDPGDKLLVIAPKNAFMAWEDELPKCVPETEFEFVRLTGGQGRIRDILGADPNAVIISYHQLPRVMNEIASYLSRNRVYMFIDESHRMKRGIEGIQGSTILSLSHLPKSKLILTGTPMPNSLDDLIPQFKFLYPELPVNLSNIVDRMDRIYVRTTKDELGLLPPQRFIKEIPMGPSQERLYRVLASDAFKHLQGLTVNDRLRFRHFSKCVQHMIQAASNPLLLASSSLADHSLIEDVINEGASNKIQYTCLLARKLVKEGNKVLIWSTFVQTVEHIADLLLDLGAHFIHGGVTTSDDIDAYDSREAKIKDFNDPKSSCRVLVANPAACSEGISLHHVCHHAIYVDRNYNAGYYLQSEDRIHRIGLPTNIKTYITILVSPGTIDESVNRRLQTKVQSMADVLNDPSLSIYPLDLDIEDEFEGLNTDDINDLKQTLKVN